jgi:hypothetical protein
MRCSVKVPRNLVDLVVFSLPYIEECLSVEFCIPSWNRSHVVGVDDPVLTCVPTESDPCCCTSITRLQDPHVRN